MSGVAGGCGSGHCGCGGGKTAAPVATVNGIGLHAPGEQLDWDELRERAWTELLRHEAVRKELLPRQAMLTMPQLTDADRAVIQAMVDAQVKVPQPTEAEARRYYEGHSSRFVEGAQVLLRHILFAVTDRVDVPALAARAEQALMELSHQDVAPTRFAELARELSNCPSGTQGGDLGWVGPHELAEELAQELFHQAGAAQVVGLRPRLVHSRYGFHIMDIVMRQPGRQVAFEDVREQIATLLAQQARARALHQYIRLLAGRALVEGIDLEGAQTPLVQ